MLLHGCSPLLRHVGTAFLWQLDYFEPLLWVYPRSGEVLESRPWQGLWKRLTGALFSGETPKNEATETKLHFFVADKASFPLLWILNVTVVITKSFGGGNFICCVKDHLIFFILLVSSHWLLRLLSFHVSSLFLTFNFYFLAVFPLICRNKPSMIL